MQCEDKTQHIECAQHQYARDKIFRRIADMIGNGVLTRDDILQQRLEHHRVSEMMLRFMIWDGHTH